MADLSHSGVDDRFRPFRDIPKAHSQTVKIDEADIPR
jgi:hypothetical protein